MLNTTDTSGPESFSPRQNAVLEEALRLHEARRLLLTEHVDVATAGYRVGYQSPSQFSREYSRLYGLPPLKDIEAMRGQMAAE